MNSKKFATTAVVAAAALLGASGSFAYGTSNDIAAQNGAPPAAIALNPNGDVLTQSVFRSEQSRSDVSRGAAQSRQQALPAVAANPNGPTVVAQPTFRSEQSRAEVRQDVAQNREVLPAIASNPNGDDALLQAATARSDNRRTALGAAERDDRS